MHPILRFSMLRRFRQLSLAVGYRNLSTEVLPLYALGKGEKEAFAKEKPIIDPSDRWILLPPIPRPKELTVALGNSEVTAIKWVSRCCPQISHSAIERLFRTRQVRVRYLEPQEVEEIEEAKLKRISRKDILPEGSVVYLRRFMLDESESRDQESAEYMQKDKNWVSTRKIYKPTHDDIKWARELVLHLDDHIIAINKPYGLAVQGGTDVGKSLDDLLGPAFTFEYEDSPKLVHRLDKDTSGIMVLGRTPESTAILHDMFRIKTANAIAPGCKESEDGIRAIKRKYLALVIGTPTKRKGRIVAPLRKIVLDGGTSEAIVVADDSSLEGAMEAVTEFRVLGRSLYGCTWLELHPFTGRKHQLRVHCAQALGMPILGDYKYGRQAHEKWFTEAREELDLDKAEQSSTLRKTDVSIYAHVKGSVTSERPFLHLHSRLLAIPKIRKLKKRKRKTDDGKLLKDKVCFVDNLRLLAPLPPHMKASWNLLPPTMKEDLHEQFVERLGIKGEHRERAQ